MTRLFLLGLLFLATPGVAQEVPALTGRVVDRADVLSAQTEAAITTLLKAHEDSTSNQIAVLTIRSLDGAVLEEYSLAVATTWGLGTAANDNGVLLLIAVDDRKMRIEVGDGLEGDLPDAVAGRIIRNEIAPRFREGDFDAGVLAGVQAIIGAIEGSYVASPAGDDFSGEMPPFWFGLLFLIVPSIFYFFAIFSPGCMRWFLFLFLIPFFGVGGLALTGSFIGAMAFLALYAISFIVINLHPKIRAIQKKVNKAHKSGESVKVGPFTFSPSSGSSGGGWSSGGSSFSGGGGSFSGGGASGGW